ncbi:MAG: hypothetical protein ACLRSY_09520, partial [Acutalibacter sp.]
SLDLKAGQAVDRVGLLLGLSFPCGPELERLALQWEGKLSYRPVLKGHDCSLSGIENQCKAMVDRGEPPAKIARHCLEAIASVLDKMCSRLLEELGPLPVVFSGGVCSNSLLRQRLGRSTAPPSPRRSSPRTTPRGWRCWPGKRGAKDERSGAHRIPSEFLYQVPYRGGRPAAKRGGFRGNLQLYRPLPLRPPVLLSQG